MVTVRRIISVCNGPNCSICIDDTIIDLVPSKSALLHRSRFDIHSVISIVLAALCWIAFGAEHLEVRGPVYRQASFLDIDPVLQ